jgi:hypothetical protein
VRKKLRNSAWPMQLQRRARRRRQTHTSTLLQRMWQRIKMHTLRQDSAELTESVLLVKQQLQVCSDILNVGS